MKDLLENRAKVGAEIKALTDKIIGESRAPTDEERTKLDTLNEEYDALTEQIKLRKRAEQIDADGQERQEPESTPTPGPGREDRDGREDPQTRQDRPAVTEEHRALALNAWFRLQSSEDLELTDEHKEACQLTGFNPRQKVLHIPLAPSHRFSAAQKLYRGGFGQTYNAGASGIQERALSALVGASGGATVPETLRNQLEINMLAYGGMMQAGQIIRTASGEQITWPTVDDTTNSGRQLGESAAVTATDPSFGGVTWTAYKFSSDEIKVPTELLEDSVFDLPGILGELLGIRLGRILNSKFTTGAGAGTPKGATIAAAAGVTTAGATAITWAELTNMIHKVDPAYRAGSAWMFHDNIYLYIRKLLDADNRPLWADGPNSTPPGTLQGYPYFINQDMASTVTTTQITALFGRFDHYKIRMVNDIRMYRLTERHRENDQDAFLAFVRADGNLLSAGTDVLYKLTQT